MLMVVAGCGFRIAGSADAALSDDASDGPAVDVSLGTCNGAGLACPSGTTPHAIGCGTGCWYGCRDGSAITEPEAAALCIAWGGKLGRIDSAADETCMRTVLDGAIWVGIEQAANQATPIAGWSWNNDGTAPPYLRWASGQPNDGDGTEDGVEQCAYSSTSTTWQDTPCTAQFSRFGCRK
jgi:hypothetical protein